MNASAAILDDQARLDSLAAALDEVHREVKAQMGEDDVRRVRTLHRISRGCEVAGRLLIHFSLEPVSFLVGVGTLWLHKQLQATELGHPILHGSYDKLEGAEAFRSDTWYWDVPIDEKAWHVGHNLKHHPYTNVTGRDPDVHFGPVRLNDHVPHRWYHYVQLPYTVLSMWSSFAWGMNLHFSGVVDVFRPEGEGDFLPDKKPATVLGAFRTAFRKYVPYYAYNFVLFPALAGPMWWKVLLGNWMAETMRDYYSAASIFCGHIGSESFPEGTQARGRGSWYAMQINSTRNYQVPYILSVLCGGLDCQIEHHLFPKLPPERLRQIAPRVREIAEAHGLTYRTDSWGNVLRDALGELWRLSFPTPQPA